MLGKYADHERSDRYARSKAVISTYQNPTYNDGALFDCVRKAFQRKPNGIPTEMEGRFHVVDGHFKLGIEIPNERLHEGLVSKKRHVRKISERNVHPQRIIAEIRNFDKDLSTFAEDTVELWNETPEVIAFHVFEDMSCNDEIHAGIRYFRKMFDNVGEDDVAFFGFLLGTKEVYGRFREIDERDVFRRGSAQTLNIQRKGAVTRSDFEYFGVVTEKAEILIVVEIEVFEFFPIEFGDARSSVFFKVHHRSY